VKEARLLPPADGRIESVTDVVELPRVAIRMTVSGELVGLVPSVNMADVAPAAIVTDEGTVTEALVAVSETVAPPAGAGVEADTVQEVDELPLSVVDSHWRDRLAGPVSEIVAEALLLLSEAVRVTD